MTFLSDEAESKQWKNKDFTSVSTDVLDAMLTHEVSGGGVDSYERLGTAVRMSTGEAVCSAGGRKSFNVVYGQQSYRRRFRACLLQK